MPLYFKSESQVLNDRYRQTIKDLLDEIKKNKGYHLFTQLFDIKAFNRETNEQVIPECLEVIDILNNQTEIRLPWEVKGLIQYKDEIEKEFIKDPISKNDLFVGSCVLVNKELKHRVLIKKSSDGSFNLFSCYLKNETFCPYEVNK